MPLVPQTLWCALVSIPVISRKFDSLHYCFIFSSSSDECWLREANGRNEDSSWQLSFQLWFQPNCCLVPKTELNIIRGWNSFLVKIQNRMSFMEDDDNLLQYPASLKIVEGWSRNENLNVNPDETTRGSCTRRTNLERLRVLLS